MKRRAFLSAAALLSLTGIQNALGAPKKSAKSAKTAKPAKSTKPSARGRGRNNTAFSGPVRSAPLNTADHTVIDAPPPGSTASRLPPVKAPDLPAVWQDFEVTTQLNLNSGGGVLRVWLPLPLNQDTLYQRNLGYEWRGNAESVRVQRLPDGEQEILVCQWPSGQDAQLTLIQRVSIAERNFDIGRRSLPPEREDILRRHLRATADMPNEGAIYDLASKIIERVKDPVAQAKALFDWVTDNSAYLADLPGGGTGNVRQQLNSGRFGGGSADITALFVCLCRSLGIPARQVFGLRIDRSLMTDTLSANPDNLNQAQHCRAEFYVPGYSWIPVDPADVCRANSRMSLNTRDLHALRRSLFGAWEVNWMAYGLATDFTLPGTRSTQPFLIQPLITRGNDRPQAAQAGLSGVTQYQVRSQRRLTAL